MNGPWCRQYSWCHVRSAHTLVSIWPVFVCLLTGHSAIYALVGELRELCDRGPLLLQKHTLQPHNLAASKCHMKLSKNGRIVNRKQTLMLQIAYILLIVFIPYILHVVLPTVFCCMQSACCCDNSLFFPSKYLEPLCQKICCNASNFVYLL